LVFGRKILHGSGERCKVTEELMDPIMGDIGLMDTVVPSLIFEKGYKCIIPDRTYWTEAQFSQEDIVFYTDGSQKGDSAGAGICLPQQDAEWIEPLGEGVTALQAEVFGITEAASIALTKGWSQRSIYICSDSQEAIKSLDSPLVSSRLVKECKERLHRLSQ